MDKEVRRLAHQFFITYKISKVTLPDIKRIIESQGFVIIRFNGLGNQPDVDSLLTCLNLQSIAARSRGFTYVDSHFRLVFIHESLSDDEMLAVLAHEEGHIYCGHMQYNAIIGQDIKEEMEATEFAICIMEEHKAIEAEIWLRSHRWLTSTIALLVIVFSIVNISPFGTSLGIMGKQRWMAPEIVTGGVPDKQSDRFSLAVVLFRLLFINHPLEGRYSTPPCMTKELERKYYGTAPVFIYDPDNQQNRPIPGTDQNLRLFWPAYPQYIRDAFIRAFSNDVMMKKAPRILEIEWLNLFFRLRAETVLCPYCKRETFFDVAMGNCVCMECGKRIGHSAVLKTKHFNLPIYAGQKVYLWHVDSSREDIETVLADVIRNPSNPAILGLRNLSQHTWMITLPDGSQRPLVPGNVVPAKDKFGIDFIGNGQCAATVVL